MFILCSIASVMEKHVVFWYKDAGWVTKLYRKPALSRLRWLVYYKEQCSFATRDCCLTDRADLTVGPTLSSEKSGRVF